MFVFSVIPIIKLPSCGREFFKTRVCAGDPFIHDSIRGQRIFILKFVFANPYDLCNLLVHYPGCFHLNGIHASLNQRRKMIVALVVDLFYDFWAEVKLFGHALILPNLFLLVS
jgi:hypothetical protein